MPIATQTVAATPALSSVRNGAKDMLARILASENLTVRHDPTASTASMDVVNRVLTLPVWINMTNEVYDMLIGHEVGHALFTPHDERDEQVKGPWCAAAEEIAGVSEQTKVAQIMLNIVEDARIERMMKSKFPGMRRDFFKAYEYMVDHDFFGVAGKDMNTLSFIDRINLHYKIGTCKQTGITFTPDEQQYIDRIDAAKTFDDVVSIVRDMWKDGKQNDRGQQQEAGKGDDGDSDGQMDADGSDSSDQGQPNQQSNRGNGRGDQSKSDQQGDSASGDKQDDQRNRNDNGASSNGADKQSEQHSWTPGATQQKLDSSLNSNTKRIDGKYEYMTMPDCNLDSVIMGWRRIADDFAKHDAAEMRKDANYSILTTLGNEMASKFMADSKPIVSLMVKEFEMRKAADASARTRIAATGVIDTVRVCNYRIADDIFRRNAVVAAGKNHGFVMFLDWSGSMGPVIGPVLAQALQVMMFCRRVGIPFDVYAFSSGGLEGRKDKVWNRTKETDIDMSDFTLLHLFSSTMNAAAFNRQVSYIWRFANSNTIVREAMQRGNRIGYGYAGTIYPYFMSMCSTPLDEAIAAAMKIVPEFRKRHRVQIVNAVFMTDGATTCPWARGGNIGQVISAAADTAMKYKSFLVINGKNYEAFPSSTSAMLNALRDVAGCRVVGFFLSEQQMSKRHTELRVEEAKGDKYSGGKIHAPYRTASGFMPSFGNPALLPCTRATIDSSWSPLPLATAADCEFINREVKRYAEEDYCVAHEDSLLGSGYDKLFVLRANLTVDNTDYLDALNAETATVAQVKRALLKSARGKIKSRKMFTQFIDLISVQA